MCEKPWPKTEKVFRVQLSASGLRNVQQKLYENDFTFIVGSERYRCPSFIAEFLSPRISHLRSIDPTLNEFLIDCEDSDGAFSHILVSGEGLIVRVTESNQEVLRRFCTELRNSELFGSIFHAFEKELSVKCVISRLSFRCDAESDCELDQKFASAHFWELLNHESSGELSLIEFPEGGLR
jgi:hypothetical protein